MNTLIELNPTEAADAIGGIDAVTAGLLVFAAGFIAANWTAIKSGFADGVDTGYHAVAF